ncbi:MAG: 3-phosphoshikimate 1-carboxyvinyltransferase, partial [Deltaproteobacteria bacterium]|nr:3-phosphoshikimate 1-carboxyvinyltransferase [Deltaproteobacteria bacterium]
KRVLAPLHEQGVQVLGRDDHQYAPVTVFGCAPTFFEYAMPIASAQVKSALMLFALQGEGVHLTGIGTSRDHTERMLKAMGGNIEEKNDGLILRPAPLHPICVSVPGDPSSAAFFIALGVLCGKDVYIESVGVNPTRIAFIRALQKMGGNISFHNERIEGGEPVADISVQKSSLKGIEIDPDTVPAQLDEFPLLAVVAVFAQGHTIVRGAKELRVKESDRIRAIVTNLRAMGAEIEELPDGFIVEGTGVLMGAVVDSFHDHRIAMASAVAGLMAKGETTVTGVSCISISFPDFVKKLVELGAKCRESEQ